VHTEDKANDILLSVVIPCFNAMPYIEEALNTIIEWPSDLVEVIVQDGASTDGTLQLLQRFGDRINLESQRDHGQTDALNRGISRSTGRFVGWLNADDLYAPEAWPIIRPLLECDDAADAYFGDYALIFSNGDIMRRMVLSDIDWRAFMTKGRPVWSGATFFHRRVFDEFGLFDETLDYCMDGEFFLRVAGHINTRYVPYELGRFRIHGRSKTGSQRWAFWREAHQVRWKYAGGDFQLQLATLKLDLTNLIYHATQDLRYSRLWSKIRGTREYRSAGEP